jgi:hypothetical protein
MVLTRAERQTALAHVVTNVFMLDDDSPLSLALTKAFLVDIYDILAMPFHDIERLDYVDNQGNEILLPSSYQYMLQIIKHYDLYRTLDGDPIGDEWKTVTAHQYDEYCLSQDYAGVASLSSSPQVSSGTNVAPGASTLLVHVTWFLNLKRASSMIRGPFLSTRMKSSGTLGNVQHLLKLELKIFMRFLLTRHDIFPFPVKTSNYYSL